jgi:hypothetical protein
MDFADDPAMRYQADQRKKRMDDQEHLMATRSWLISRGIVKEGMTKAEWQKATANYRAKIGKMQKPGGKDWAYAISRHADHDPSVNTHMLRLAKDAIGHKETDDENL